MEEFAKPETLPAVQELSFWGRLVNIFANPRLTFESLDRRPTWFWPMLFMVVITVVSTQLMFPMIIEKQLEVLRQNPNIPEEQLEVIKNQLASNSATQRVIMLVSQIIFTPLVFYVVLSFIFYFVGSVILGGDANFKRVLAGFSWSSLILVLGALILLPLGISKGTINISLSPALLLPADSVGTTLHTLLSKFDIFTIWFLAVFAAGFAVIYRFSMTKAYAAVGTLWAIWIVASTALAGVFQRFGIG